jgi:hypothetical protein
MPGFLFCVLAIRYLLAIAGQAKLSNASGVPAVEFVVFTDYSVR